MIQLTRKQYEELYGVKPVFGTTSSDLDDSPSVPRMTRAEYEKAYPSAPAPLTYKQKVMSGSPVFPAQLGGKETIIPNLARNAGNIPGAAFNLARGVVAPVNPFDLENPMNIGAAISKGGELVDDIYKDRGFVEGSKDIVAGFAGTAKKGFELWKTAGESIYKNLEKNVLAEGSSVADGVGISTAEAVSKVAELVLNDPTLVPSLLYAPKATRLETGVDYISTVASPVTKPVNKIKAVITNKLDDTINLKRERELFEIESGSAGTRKANEFTNDAGRASRQRIAKTDVLVDSVDKDGIIRTKLPGGAIEKYKAQTIDGVEGVVRDNLVKEGAFVNLKEIERALVVAVNRSNLEGSSLLSAMNGIKKEIAGLKLRADNLDNISLAKIHDAKISTTQNINYLKDSTPTIKFRKAKASAFKNLVEKKSKFNVKAVNEVLSRYYEDIARLERLDGKRVKGGRLGKYFAQVSGNIIGGTTGNFIGGPAGMAIGTIVGGEAASLLKGKSMSSTFGKARGLSVEKNPILEKARASAKAPAVVDLRKPSLKVGAPKNVPKTKEIFKLEKDIARNVEAQKLAIKAGNFTLVAALKEVYNALVETLKDVIQKIKDTPNKQGGFVRNPFVSDQSKSLGKRKMTYSKTSPPNSKAIDSRIPSSTEKFYIKGRDGKMLGSIPRNKIETVETRYVKGTEDLQNALEDVNVGQNSMTNLPILVQKNADGTVEILDGNHRFAKALRDGKTDIEIMTDEKLYRQLSSKLDKNNK